MPIRVPNANIVPRLNPGVDREVILPVLTRKSIASPPKEYKIPAKRPSSANSIAWNLAKERDLIFSTFAIYAKTIILDRPYLI
jgi:hypothetical protein